MNDDRVAKVLLKAANVAFGGDLGGIASTILSDNHGTWDPVVPADLHSNPLPPVAEDGTAECWQCNMRFAFAQLDIAGNAYVCRPCLLREAQATAALTPPIEDIKLGRSWIRIAAIIGTTLALIGAGVFIYVMRQP